jgi:trehalose 6-phosphate synthase
MIKRLDPTADALHRLSLSAGSGAVIDSSDRLDAPFDPDLPEPDLLGDEVASSELAALAPGQRLVVVSNRVPVPTKDGSSTAGGLTVALEGALKEHGGLWFGWSGKTVDRPATAPNVIQAGNVTFAVIDLARRDHDLYYAGFANRALWPICHYRLDLLQIDGAETEGYFRVNRLFAEALGPLLRPDDVIWIHDYHFIPLAMELRRLGFKNRIGFFLHIPWPPSDVASALPGYERLLRGFAAYDVAGFHTPQDADNFRMCLVREKIGTPLPDGDHQIEQHRVRIGVFPVGIDTASFARTAAAADRNSLVRRMRASMGDRALIIGVDRLDYSKGIKERVESFSCFIRQNPQFRNRVTYLQVTPKSRSEVPEYRRMQREIAEQTGSTNGSLGEVDWTPIRYINKTVGHTALAGLYRMAEVGLVTPLRDGMNLVAKEYVAAQRPDNPGVLILSRFAGAAHELDCALLVNPYDTETVSAALARALVMPVEERKERWTTMIGRLERNGVNEWCQTFLAALARVAIPGSTADAGAPYDGRGRRPSSRVRHSRDTHVST